LPQVRLAPIGNIKPLSERRPRRTMCFIKSNQHRFRASDFIRLWPRSRAQDEVRFVKRNLMGDDAAAPYV
jgi:hypothetical protein